MQLDKSAVKKAVSCTVGYAAPEVVVFDTHWEADNVEMCCMKCRTSLTILTSE
jgi:hypothetical protein